jgi:type VI secretion system ImpC/EvpB family protein
VAAALAAGSAGTAGSPALAEVLARMKPDPAHPPALPPAVRARRFLASHDTLESLRLWSDGRDLHSPEEAVADLERDLAAIDEMIADQVNEILHEPAFQRLEARWRGLLHLVEQVESRDDEAPQAMVKVYDVEWRELANDLEFSPEFTQSQLFRRVYDEEFGAPGGQPFGLLLGDFEIGAGTAGSPQRDLSVLRLVADTAAAAFAPFIAQASPALLGLGHMRELQRQLDLRLRFDSPEMIRWKELRRAEEARFLGLTVPRTLARLPYRDDGVHDFGFRFDEDVSAPEAGAYCWGSGIWALGGVAMRVFQECGWFADMRGVRPGMRGGGLVDGLPRADHGTDAPGIAIRTPLEVMITDETERELAEHGFICLCPNGDNGDAAFYTVPSLSRPPIYSTDEANANASISAMLPYLLSVSRFAHALKVIARDRIGAAEEASTLQSRLRDWIRAYVVEGSLSSPEQRARFPLSGADIQLEPVEGGAGHYNCVVHLEPHLQFDQVVASMTLKTRLERRR